MAYTTKVNYGFYNMLQFQGSLGNSQHQYLAEYVQILFDDEKCVLLLCVEASISPYPVT